MSTAAELRREAEQLRALARNTLDAALREELVAMIAELERLAREADIAAGRNH